MDNENSTYHMSEISMAYAEKLTTKEDVKKEAWMI